MNRKYCKIGLVLTVLLISFPFIIPFVRRDNKTGNDEYILFSRHYVVFGRLHREEIFSTPSDCEKVNLDVKIGPFFTDVVGIYIKSEEEETYHTIFGTPFYIFGVPITFGGYYYFGDVFLPGKQIMSVDVPIGFGIFYVEVRGES